MGRCCRREAAFSPRLRVVRAFGAASLRHLHSSASSADKNLHWPPSTRMIAPVVKEEAGLARKRAAVTISSGRPGRPSALLERSRASSVQALEMSVRKGPGESVLTRTLGPYSRAKETVMALSAALAPL